MSHETQVTTEHIDWFAGFGPVAVDGECDHHCAHVGQKVIAWGPSLTHYELVECTECGCRAWKAALPRSHGGIRESHPFLKVAAQNQEAG